MKEYYTMLEVANELGFHKNTLINWVNSGKVKATKIMGIWKIHKSELERLKKGK